MSAAGGGKQVNRFKAAALLGALSALAAGPAAAQIAPLVTTIPNPPFATGPLSQSLTGAYRAIVGAAAANPAAAARASFLYAQARAQASRGDRAGALASAAAAQAAAGAPAVAGIAAARAQSAATAVTPPATGVPIVQDAAALPTDLLVARNEIELAQNVRPGASLDDAKRHYRNALDAYLSGNAAKAAAEARASFDLAAEVFSKAK